MPRLVVRRAVPAVATVAGLAYGWWVTGLEPFTWASAIAVLGAGAVAAGLGTARPWTSRRPRVRRGTRAGFVPWALLVVALAAVQLLAFGQQPRSDHPTLSHLVNAALDPRASRAVAFGLWLAVAAWLAKR